MKDRKKEKEFRKQVRRAIEMIDFAKKKELPVKATGTYITVGNYKTEE